jgi:putative ABC transport system permease protein
MGALRADVLRLLGWQFARPVLLANLIAWPVAYFVMTKWLDGFAYHIELGLLTFMFAGLMALLIALASVTCHALIVTRAKSVKALRHE